MVFLQGVGARLGGSSGRPTPTHHSPIELRRGRRPRRPALPRVRCALAMTGFYKGAVCGGTHGSRPTAGFCRARVLCRECGALSAGGQRRPPLRSATRSAVERADVGIGPYESVTRSAFGIGRAGKSAKRCQWQRKRAGFEEVPRLAATTVAGNRLARRWAREPRPYGGVTRSAMRGGIPQSRLRRASPL